MGPTCIIYLRNMHVKSCNHIITYIITFNIIISYDNHLTLSKRTHNGHKPNAHKLGRYNYPLLTGISSSNLRDQLGNFFPHLRLKVYCCPLNYTVLPITVSSWRGSLYHTEPFRTIFITLS